MVVIEVEVVSGTGTGGCCGSSGGGGGQWQGRFCLGRDCLSHACVVWW